MSINVGDLLRQAREEKNITLEEVSEETKIQKRYLKALENEEYDELPGEVHVKGFMRNYCKVVGLNPDEILEKYKESKSSEKEGMELEPPKKRKKNKILFVLIAVAIGSMLLFKNYFFKSKLERNQDQEKVKIELSEPNVEKIDEIKEIEEIEQVEKLREIEEEEIKDQILENKVIEAKVLEEKEENLENVIIEEKEVIAEKNIEVISDEEKTNEENKKVIKENLVFDKKIKLLVKEKSWMEIKKNNIIIFSGILENTEKIFSGNKNDKFELKVGNAGSVEIIYNDNDLGILGKPKQVVKKVF